MSVRDLILARRQREAGFERFQDTFRAVLIAVDSATTAAVANRPGHVWFVELDAHEDATPGIAFNRKTSYVPGLKVTIKRWPKLPYDYEVVDWDASGIKDLPGYSGTPLNAPHAQDHIDGYDPLILPTRNLSALRTYVTPGSSALTVNVAPYGAFAGVNDLDLSSSQPSSGLARYVLVYLDADDAIQTVDGATATDIDTVPPALPDTPAGGIASATVRIDGDQVGISEADIVEGRRILGGGAGGVWPAAGEIKIGSASYATLAAAAAAAISGDVVLLGPGLYAANNVSFASGVSVEGSGIGATTITQTSDADCLALGGGSVVASNFSISISINSANARSALKTTSIGVRVQNVSITGANAGAGTTRGISIASGDVFNCEINVDGIALLNTSGNTNVYSGNYDGDVFDVQVSGTAVYLFFPRLVNATFSGLNIFGIYQNSSGRPFTRPTSRLTLGDHPGLPPLNVTERSTAPTTPAAGDIYLDDGANTASGLPGWRRWTGSVWEDIGAAAGSGSAITNLIANGDFYTWDTPGGVTMAGLAQFATGWFGDTEGATAATATRNSSDTPDDTTRYVLDVVADDNNNGGMGAYYVLPAELSYRLRGQAVSFGIDLKEESTSEIQAVRIHLLNWTGTADAPLARVTGANPVATYTSTIPSAYNTGYAAINTPANLSTDDTWQRFTVENQTAPTTCVNLVVLISWGFGNNPSGVSMRLANAQLEISATASDYDPVPSKTIRQQIDNFQPVAAYNYTEYLYEGRNMSLSDFVSTIATLPGGAVLTYGAVTSGNENVIVPFSTGQAAKMVLHNTTRGNDALILDANTGTNTITLTDTAPGDWQTSDAITIRSQTNTAAGASFGSTDYFVDFEIVTALPDNVRDLFLFLQFQDSGSTGILTNIHPYQADVVTKRLTLRTVLVGPPNEAMHLMHLIENRFCASWNASGTGTARLRVAYEGIVR